MKDMKILDEEGQPKDDDGQNDQKYDQSENAMDNMMKKMSGNEKKKMIWSCTMHEMVQ